MPGHSVDIPRCPYLCRPNHPLAVRTLYLPSEPFTCRPNPLPSVRTIHPLAVRTHLPAVQTHLPAVPPPLVRPSFRLPSGLFSYRPDPPSTSRLALSTENKAPKKSSHLPQ